MRIFRGRLRPFTIIAIITLFLFSYYLGINYLINGESSTKLITELPKPTEIILPTFTPAPKQVRVRYYPTPTAQPGQVANNTNQAPQQVTSQTSNQSTYKSNNITCVVTYPCTGKSYTYTVDQNTCNFMKSGAEGTCRTGNAAQQMQTTSNNTSSNVVVPTINTQINMPVQPTSGVPVGYGAN